MLFLLGCGWCVLRSSREPYRNATLESTDTVDDVVNAADAVLCSKFREWMAACDDPWLKWELHEHLNYHNGILLFCVATNHRASVVWDMIEWITENGPGSYGLFYVHDDEDLAGNRSYGRGQNDFSNEFRVHRIANGQVTELADPFLSPIVPMLNPNHWA